MRLTSTLLSSVYLAITYGNGALAAPWAPAAKHTTHSVRSLKSGLQLESYHPESIFEIFGIEGLDHVFRKRADLSIGEIVSAFVSSRLGVLEDAIGFRTDFAHDVARHAYVQQQHEGIAFANAVANIAFDLEGRVTSFGSSFVKPTTISSSIPSLKIEDAISSAVSALGGKFNEHPAKLEYVVKADHSAALAHVVQVQNDATGEWYQAFVDAHNGDLLSVVDFVSHATYRVLPITSEIVTDGFQTLKDPEDKQSSPYGWLSSSGKGDEATTSGNNAHAYMDTKTARQSNAGEFVYNHKTSAEATTPDNQNAAIVNAFYIVNKLHDITYKYGFTEAGFNFQNTQVGEGGKGGDRVEISVQDNGGVNNANFATPPDGQSGQMRMFLWNITSPARDGALENDIVVHENTHGISNRMTGGGSGACLQTTEAGGMGEGWSDAVAFWTEQTSATVKDYIMGQYVTNNRAGIRSHPYSTSKTVNPYTYATIQTQNEVHDIGEVWANILVNVYAALVKAHGFDQNAQTDASGSGGNTVFLHLLLDGFALQPCNPTFVSARDAIIQADANRYKAANKCTLWKAFASRGLGQKAQDHKDDATIPADC